MAAHLQYRAAPNTIVISEATAQLVQGLIQMEVAGSLAVENLSTPLTIYRVQRVIPSGTALLHQKRFRSRFVGREKEGALLHQCLERVQHGRGHVIGIVGDPGIGKSRLFYEF